MEAAKTFDRNGIRYRPGDALPADLDTTTLAHYQRHGMVREARTPSPSVKKPAAPRKAPTPRPPENKTAAGPVAPSEQPEIILKDERQESEVNQAQEAIDSEANTAGAEGTDHG